MIKLPCQNKKYIFKVIQFLNKEEVLRGRNPAKYFDEKSRCTVYGVYTNGNCGAMSTALKKVFNCMSSVTFTGGHVLTRRGDSFYDAHGLKKAREYEECSALTDSDVEEMSYNYEWLRYCERFQKPKWKTTAETIELCNIEKQNMAESTSRLLEYIKTDEFLR